LTEDTDVMFAVACVEW